MFTATPSRRRTALAAAAVATALGLTLTACGSSSDSSSMPGMSSSTASMPSTSSMPSMPGMDHAGGSADGLSDAENGYRLSSDVTSLPAGRASEYRFTVTGPDGKPVTAFAVDQTKRLHFYAIRSDLTGFQHLHPAMAADGTWTAGLDGLTPGSWRLYTSFTPDSGPGKGSALLLSRTVTVPGGETATPLPAAAAAATVDGYVVTVGGEMMAGMAHELTVGVTKDGKPVTDLQPYLDTYAHLTAFHEGDLAFAHLHPETGADGGHGGPELSFHAELARPGNWRLFLQFQTGGQLHTAALTLHVG